MQKDSRFYQCGALISLAFFSLSGNAAPTQNLNRVFVNAPSLSIGDDVELYRIKDECKWPSATSPSDPSCRVSLGSGQVVQVLDDKHVMIDAERPIKSDSRTIAEKAGKS